MDLEKWLKKNCPNEGPRWYTFDYSKFKNDNEVEFKNKSQKFAQIIEETIMEEIGKLRPNDPYACQQYVTGLGGQRYDIETLGNYRYVVDTEFIKNLIAKIGIKIESTD